MPKYALVQNGKVQSVFYSDKSKDEFPDVAPHLHAVDHSVECNWLYHEGHFYPPPAPVEITDESGNTVNWVVPDVNFVKKNLTWQDAAVGASAVAVALAAQYFLKIFG